MCYNPYMKLLRNASFILNIAASAKIAPHYRRLIDKAVEAGDQDAERSAIAEGESEWAKDAVRRFDLHYEVRGRENIPECACVFVAKHQSDFDVMAMMVALDGHPASFIAKSEFEKVPLLGPWVVRTRGLFIQRGDARESLKTIQKGVEYLKDGWSLIIFPEGTRSRGPEMAEFKPGSFKLATKAKVPVVPITIDGTYRSFEEDGAYKSGQSAVITIHPPIETAGLSRTEQAELGDKVWKIVHDALTEKA